MSFQDVGDHGSPLFLQLLLKFVILLSLQIRVLQAR